LHSKSGFARLEILLAVAFLLFISAGRAGAQKKTPPAQPVDLNSASAAELQQVPGIGPATAKSIINFREKSGPFRRVEDLLAIHGISKTALEKMRPYVRVKPLQTPSTKKSCYAPALYSVTSPKSAACSPIWALSPTTTICAFAESKYFRAARIMSAAVSA